MKKKKRWNLRYAASKRVHWIGEDEKCENEENQHIVASIIA